MTETDEMYQNAGKKGEWHPDPNDPPLRRANKQRGHGTYANDRPPIVGTVGRESGQVRLRVVKRTNAQTLNKHMTRFTQPDSVANTVNGEATTTLIVSTSPSTTGRGEYARDDDGDGVREVHINTAEGMWTSARNFLRPFRGVHKEGFINFV